MRQQETGEKLAKRFGWWWWGDPVPVKSLRRAFPEKSEQGIRRFLWPELERSALNYELASRADGLTKYLLGKPFDCLTREQMCGLMKLWPRKPRPLEPIRFMLHEDETAKWLRLFADEDSLPVSANLDRDRALMRKRVRKRAQQMKSVEMNYAKATGWTVPQYITINLRGCSSRAIVEALKRHVATERERLRIKPPPMNKGRANKSSKRGLSFRRIEALDAWTHLPREQMPKEYAFDDAQARRARREAKELFAEWKQRTEEKRVREK